jgi:hypothetical protein
MPTEGDPMRRTIYLPDDLARRVEDYLREHPGLSLSTLVREALDSRLMPPDPRAILDLAGLVPDASTAARERAEDQLFRHER